MRITIIGYGKMGNEIEDIAASRGHEIVLRIDRDNSDDFDSPLFSSSDVAMEFSTPETAFENISRCIEKGIPVVSGTTGWTGRLKEAEQIVKAKKGSFLYASNFSIGVNILFNLNRRLAGIMDTLSSYGVEIEELHHSAKKDAPSGTAIKLAEDIISRCSEYSSWSLNNSGGEGEIGIHSVREGDITGTHRVEWNSDTDSLSLEHKAHSRQGFALGAVLAAEFIHKRQGIFTMGDLLGF